jgi:hypothetical protein
MKDEQGSNVQSGPVNEESLRRLLKQQGIENLDDLIRHAAQQLQPKVQSLAASPGGAGPGTPGNLEWTALADSEKWVLVMSIAAPGAGKGPVRGPGRGPERGPAPKATGK